MKNWEHLIQTGMAEMAPPEIAGAALDKVMSRFRRDNTEASVRLLRIIRNHFKVVLFKENAVIIDYGQENMQLMFRHTGKVRVFMNINEKWATEGLSSNDKETIFLTQEPYTNKPSTKKIVVEESAVFVTLHWDDHEYLSRKYQTFSSFALATAMNYSREVDRRLGFSLLVRDLSDTSH